MSKELSSSEGLLVLPHLRIQNANAISSPMTHGFPSMSAFLGLMWALERKLSASSEWGLRFKKVGVICHSYQEQVNDGYVKTFNLTRNPLTKEGNTAAIVEEGRMHLEITLVFLVQQKFPENTEQTRQLVQGNEQALQEYAQKVLDTLMTMRVAGGSVLPSKAAPGKRIRPWMPILPDDATAREKKFRTWRRQWLPGFVLVERQDLLSERLQHLKECNQDATIFDAWLHASRFNWEAGSPDAHGNVQWHDPYRPKGSGWIVPIPVGYVGLSRLHDAGEVLNTRDVTTPFRFVETLFGLGEWIGPHRLNNLDELFWYSEVNDQEMTYRCRNTYRRIIEDVDGDEEYPDLDSYE